MKNRNCYSCVDLPSSLVEEIISILDKIQEKYPNFKPMTEDMMHMTFIYLGENLSYNATMQLADNFNISGDWSLIFEGYELFPPQKQNLVIGRFSPGSSIMDVRNTIVTNIGPANLKDKEPYLWIPHITLGKLVGKQVKNIDLSFPSISSFKSSKLKVISPYHYE